MDYNFETITPRYNMGSAKWDQIQVIYPDMPKDIIPFSVADMEFQTAPEIVNGLKKFIDSVILGYTNATDAFKNSVCRWMQVRHGWNAEPSWILSTHGCVEAFYTAVQCYTEENDGVLLLTPVYYPMYSAIKHNNRKLVDCPLVKNGDTYDINWDDFEEKLRDENTKMFILCSPHNPCGRVWKPGELRRIAELCSKYNVVVIADEIHHDLIMPGHSHIVYAAVSKEAEQNCVVLTAPSKTFNLAGLQTSNVFIPNDQLREQFLAQLKTGTANPKCNILGYEACRIAYDQCAQWLDACIAVIDRNRQIVVDFLARNFPQIKVFDMQGTYLLWMDWNGLGLNYKELERINHEEAQLFFDEGYVFGKQGEGFERWNLACPTAYVESALNRMKKAYDRYVK